MHEPLHTNTQDHMHIQTHMSACTFLFSFWQSFPLGHCTASFIAPPHLSHRLICHIASFVTSPHLSDRLIYHIASFVTSPHLSHRLICHIASFVTSPHLSRHFICHIALFITSPHLSHRLICHIPSLITSPHLAPPYPVAITPPSLNHAHRNRHARVCLYFHLNWRLPLHWHVLAFAYFTSSCACLHFYLHSLPWHVLAFLCFSSSFSMLHIMQMQCVVTFIRGFHFIGSR
jgi:hypothetical protein